MHAVLTCNLLVLERQIPLLPVSSTLFLTIFTVQITNLRGEFSWRLWATQTVFLAVIFVRSLALGIQPMSVF